MASKYQQAASASDPFLRRLLDEVLDQKKEGGSGRRTDLQAVEVVSRQQLSRNPTQAAQRLLERFKNLRHLYNMLGYNKLYNSEVIW